MKLNRLETHDRLLHFKKDQALNISQGVTECLKSNSLSLALQEKSPYIYIFAHPRTADDGVTRKMYWDPRLSRPYAQTNSYLFRAQSKTDLVEVCWLIPPEEMWKEYNKGNVTESEWVLWSIDQYQKNRAALESPLPDDLEEEAGKRILQQVILERIQEIRASKPQKYEKI